jgi:hypothetical protein
MSPLDSTETAPASAAKLKTMALALGVNPAEAPIPRPDLSGARLKSPTNPDVYLVDPEGYLRLIPDPDTYNNLFRDWNGITESTDLNEIARGSDITDGAVLAKASNSDPVYLISNGIKRWITSPGVMDKYYFNWGNIVGLPQTAIDPIPQGANWS